MYVVWEIITEARLAQFNRLPQLAEVTLLQLVNEAMQPAATCLKRVHMSSVRNTLLVLVWHTGHPEEPHVIPHRPAYLSLIHLNYYYDA